MLQLIYGRAESGKTTLIYKKIKEDAAAGHKVLLLVPKQQVFEAEQRICDEGITGFSVEACGFDRLCNQIFRRYGGLCYHYIGKGAKKIVLWRALTELSESLREYREVTLADLSVLSLMQSTIEEMERCRISPQNLEDSAERLEKGEQKLKNKLRDLALIYELDLHLLHQNYDNPEEDLTRAAALLEEHDYFSGMQVYIDGFEIYTPQEAEILTHIFRQAASVTVSVPCLPGDRVEMYRLIRKSEKLLKTLADKTSTELLDPIVLEGRQGTDSAELRFLSDHLWNFSAETYPGVPRDITLTAAADIYDEAEAVACEIARLVQEEGCRYREIAVIMRSTPSYEGILDQAFEKYAIPCFSSARTKLRMKPQIRLIGAALAIGQGGWHFEDVIAYLRSGLTGIPASDCDLIEEYAGAWKISGKLWYSEDRWAMNPQGFTTEFTDSDIQLLAKLEMIRQRLIAPLKAFLEVFASKKPTVREISAALYAFLEQLHMADQLSAEEESFRKSGRFAEAQESVQVWDAILSALDSLVIVAGDMNVSAGGYADLLFTIFDSLDIGKIPARADEVLIGDPGLIHRPGVRHAFLLGLCEGVFPAAAVEDSIFGDADRDKLDQIGLELEENVETRAIKELYGVYRAVTATPGKLHLYYHADQNPSVAIFAIKSLFPDLPTEKTSEIDGIDRIYGKSAAFEYAAEQSEDGVGRAILDILSGDPEYAARVEALGRPISERDCRIDPDTVSVIMDRGLNLTQARIENFVKCPFSYYAKNILHLREPAGDDFDARDVGNFMHAVFENFLSSLNGRSVKELSDAALAELAEGAIDAYRSKIVHGRTTKRLDYLFGRLNGLSHLLIKNLVDEFREVGFEPKFFEMAIDQNPDSVKPLSVDLGDGRTISLYGRVDRVDTYKKGNDVYIRVVDYKTGSKEFSLEDVKLGLNLQMLIYLFSICAEGSPEFREKLGCAENGEIKAAGILYYLARMPQAELDSPNVDPDMLSAMLESKITRNGLLLSDIDILRAMDPNLSGKYIPVTLKKDGDFKKACLKSLASVEQFGQLMREITDKIGQIGKELLGGNAAARPMKNNRADACAYCGMRELCRVSERSEGFEGVEGSEGVDEDGES